MGVRQKVGNLIAVRLLTFSTLSQKCPSAALQAFDVRLFNEVLSTSFILTTVGPGRGRELAAAARRLAGIPCLPAEILQTSCRRPPTGRNSLPVGGNTTNQQLIVAIGEK